MNNPSSLLLYDKEFSAYLSHLESEIKKEKSLPVILNGISGGAVAMSLIESTRTVKKCTSHPSLILVPSERLRREICESLCKFDIKALEYKSRDLVFHNIRASHDLERERLLVLSAIINGDADVVVTTPEALLTYTVPMDVMSELSISLFALSTPIFSTTSEVS